jgi:hypothetical protein
MNAAKVGAKERAAAKAGVSARAQAPRPLETDGWAVPLDPDLPTPTSDLYHAFLSDNDDPDDPSDLVRGGLGRENESGRRVDAPYARATDITACGLTFHGRGGLVSRRDLKTDDHARLCRACLRTGLAT